MSRGAHAHASRPSAAKGKPAAAIPARFPATGAQAGLLDQDLPGEADRRAVEGRGRAAAFRFGTLPLHAPEAPAPQAKLKVSRPGDQYEQEADRVADTVLRMPDPSRKLDGPAARVERAGLQRAEEPDLKALYRRPEREGAEAQVSRKTLARGPRTIPPRLDGRIAALKGAGKALPDSSREFFEPRFGHDFSKVRVHTDHRAAETAGEVGARAFTLGRDVVFGAGQYQPGSSEGKRLLAHELTHTIQQGAGVRRVARRPAVLTITPATAQVQRAEGEDNEEEGGWLARKIAGVAKNIPGFTLVTYIIGKNPITGSAVKRNPKNLLRGVMGLIPGGEALFSRLDKAGAIDAAFNWLSKEIAKLGITWSGVKALFAQAWDEMSIWKGISGNLAVLKRVFAPTVGRLVAFAGRVGKKVLTFIFEGTLRLFGAPVKKIMGVLNKGASVIGSIVKDPIGFLGNLVAALKKGVSQFSANIGKHLKAGLVKWLFGTLTKAGITLPETFDLKGVFTLVAQILGLTWENIRPKIVKVIGEPAMKKLETAWDYIKTLITGGPAALWERIKEDLASLKATVMGAIKNWVITTIVKAAITKLATMFNPVGAIIEAVRGIYNTVMFFIERAKQIASMVSAVLSSIAKIAAGDITAAAKWIEASMARAIPVLLGFLARLIGLGGLSEKIRETIAKVRAPIDKALDKVIGFIAKKAKAVLAKGKAAVKAGVAKGKAVVKAGVAKGKAVVKAGAETVKAGAKKLKALIIPSKVTIKNAKKPMFVYDPATKNGKFDQNIFTGQKTLSYLSFGGNDIKLPKPKPIRYPIKNAHKNVVPFPTTFGVTGKNDEDIESQLVFKTDRKAFKAKPYIQYLLGKQDYLKKISPTYVSVTKENGKITGFKKGTNIHHAQPLSFKGKNENTNMIPLNHTKHMGSGTGVHSLFWTPLRHFLNSISKTYPPGRKLLIKDK